MASAAYLVGTCPSALPSSQWEPLLGCGFWRSPCRKWPFVPGERNPPTPPRTAARRQAAHLDLCPQSSPLLPGPPCITIGAGVSVKTGGRAALPGTLPRWPPHPPPPESTPFLRCVRGPGGGSGEGLPGLVGLASSSQPLGQRLDKRPREQRELSRVYPSGWQLPP